MKALITGGAGFIGSYLAEALLARGERVRVIDDLSTGRLENIGHLEQKKEFKFYRGTVLNRSLMERLIKESDIVYHLAASVGVKYVLENPLDSLNVNVDGTRVVLELAAKFNTKVVFASSSEIYGKNGRRLLKEDDDCKFGSTRVSRWGYSCTKALGEFLALAYHREKGLPVLIVRFFNTCGERQRPDYGMVIPRFVRQAVKGETIVIYGDGEQVRSFTYISDALNGLIGLVDSTSAWGEVFNIGSPQPTTISQLAREIKELSSSPSKIAYIPYRKVYGPDFEDMRYRVPDLSKISKAIDYKPKVDLNEMLERVIAHQRIEEGTKAQRRKGTKD